MYEVTTTIKTLLITTDEAEALKFAEAAFESHKYVEVKRVITVSPWYAESVRILTR